MKRLRLWLFNFVAALSLVLCVSCIALWAVSLVRCDSMGIDSQTIGGVSPSVTQVRRVVGYVANANGHLVLNLYVNQLRPSNLVDPRLLKDKREWSYSHQVVAANRHQFAFFQARSTTKTATGTRTDIHIEFPYWMAILPTTAIPAIWVWQRKRQMRRNGQCSRCGYDLRATPNRCPECGSIPEGAKGAAA